MEEDKDRTPPGNDDEAVARTPVPPDRLKAWILMKRNGRNDRKKPLLWFARTLGVVVLWMLYTMGFFLASRGYRTPQQDGEYILYDGEGWTYPQLVTLAGSTSPDFVSSVGDQLTSTVILEVSNQTNRTAFQEYCQQAELGDPSQHVCVFLEEADFYNVYFGGGQGEVSPTSVSLAGVQHAINSALLNVTGVSDLYPLETFQRVPQKFSDGNVSQGADLAVVLVPAIMLVLSAAIMMQFLMGPMTFEKLQEVARGFRLVGVSLRVYMLQWVAYYSMMGLLTAAALTGVSIAWNLFTLSSPGLIFLSHYTALVQLYTVATVVAQIIEQEELASGMPFLMALGSMAVATTLVVLEDSAGLTVLSIVSPFINMMHYSVLYSDYGYAGFNTGIRFGQNVQESGLMGSLLGSVFGICLWMSILVVYSAPHSRKRHHQRSTEQQQDDRALAQENFEPLPPNSEVLLSVRGLTYTYKSRNCLGKKNPPVEVLKGLDMDICRGEVFSYLGHNGAGKTTSLQILSGELDMQEGEVSYNITGGKAVLPTDLTRIRQNIGVCPQHNNTLHGDATCRETLRLFASLKGRIVHEPGQSIEEAIDAEVERRLEDIQFTSSEDADKPVSTFSGGMKRKVSIAIALLGDAECIFLDEPTAGMDPYNRRQIWDMIIAAKRGRSIILTTHFIDEADVLSDRVGIIKDGRLATCGTTLFLKHHFGAGYSLRFDAPDYVDMAKLVPGATEKPSNKPGSFEWNLQHGAESSFPAALQELSSAGATEVSLELTTLEQVFLETGREDSANETDTEGDTSDDNGQGHVQNDLDLEDPDVLEEYMKKIWEPRGPIKPLSFWQKLMQVQFFMMSNAWRIKGIVFLNIMMPMTYLVIGMVVVSLVDVPTETDQVVPDPIAVTPSLAGNSPSQCFGIPELSGNPISPLLPTDPPATIEDYFLAGGLPITCGYWAKNRTLQHNPELSPFALQVGIQVFTNYSLLLDDGSTSNGIVSSLVQLPYESEAQFRIDTLILPIAMIFGFSGMAFTVLDVLLLKSDNIIGLFRVGGIGEWTTYLGVMCYKSNTTFAPFFVLAIILGLALKSVLFGNAGRWLGTILMMLAYAYSATPLGLLLAKRFIKAEFKKVANWFPGVYMTLVCLPYLAWNILLQVLPDARDILLIVGDVLCIVPYVAFQRGLGQIIAVSARFDDSDLTWAEVWSWQNRVWFTLLIMLLTGTMQWVYLYRLTTTRPAKTQLTGSDEQGAYEPIDIGDKPDVVEERERSLASDEGIRARDLVKLFRVQPPKKGRRKKKKPILKSAVKGVSFGVQKNEVYALLGPNGAGKSVCMSILAGEYTPEHGQVVLAGESASADDPDVRHLYAKCNVSLCPQFDSLFPKMSVQEHLKFYAKVRGLDWNLESTKAHVDAIVQLLGLRAHMSKAATELSGGYKRRLSLGVSMTGYPHCMMVDEATTGMDPGARHLVWDVLRNNSSRDMPAILLSTHYMDEASKLGTRIGIMIDGELVTTGSLHDLQEHYCTSYFVEVSLDTTALDATEYSAEHHEQAVSDAFAAHGMDNARVYESLPYRFKLQVPFTSPQHNHQLADIFDVMESRKTELHIQFYSVAQMNLEQIFIDLSRKQFAIDEEQAEHQD